jgi:chaperone modulatory protein CbpM
MPHTAHLTIQFGEVLDDTTLTEADLAHACRVSIDWVRARVDADVLQADRSTGEWRFGSATLVRARRIASLESTFDADPQLAALTADLIEEVTRLRLRLNALDQDIH